jgi:hypothetical protein
MSPSIVKPPEKLLRLSAGQGQIWTVKPRVDDDGHIFGLKLADPQGPAAFSCAVFASNGCNVVAGCCSAQGRSIAPILLLQLRDNRVSRIGIIAGSCTCIAAHPFRPEIAAAGSSTGAVSVFQHDRQNKCTDLLKLHHTAIADVAFSHCGAFLVSLSHDAAIIWDSKACFAHRRGETFARVLTLRRKVL